MKEVTQRGAYQMAASCCYKIMFHSHARDNWRDVFKVYFFRHTYGFANVVTNTVFAEKKNREFDDK